jgi:hypothetical protein
MGNTLISVLSELAGHLLFVSATAALLVTAAWAIITMGRIKAAAHRHIIWLSTLFIILAFPVMWRYVPKMPVEILPAQGQSEIAVTPSVKNRFWCCAGGWRVFGCRVSDARGYHAHGGRAAGRFPFHSVSLDPGMLVGWGRPVYAGKTADELFKHSQDRPDRGGCSR